MQASRWFFSARVPKQITFVVECSVLRTNNGSNLFWRCVCLTSPRAGKKKVKQRILSAGLSLQQKLTKRYCET